jgi:Fur family ferric uptake transcriptional regulator
MAMVTKEEKFRDFLAGRGLRSTPERARILDRIFATHEHFQADNLLKEMRSRGPRVSKATIYRTLALLVESGLLRQVMTGEKHAHYEHVFGHAHHDHMTCTRCGEIVEFFDPEIERLQEKICEQKGFRAEGHRMQILGLCAKCARKSKGGTPAPAAR